MGTPLFYLIKNLTKGNPSNANSQGSPLVRLNDKQKADIAREKAGIIKTPPALTASSIALSNFIFLSFLSS